MNLFTQSSPYYHLLKYLLFLLKHPVYTHILKHRLENTLHFVLLISVNNKCELNFWCILYIYHRNIYFSVLFSCTLQQSNLNLG